MSTVEVEPAAAPQDVPASEEVWEEQGREFARRADATAWEIGDWLIQGAALDGDAPPDKRYMRAAKLSGLKYGTLRNRASVARAFDPSRRRDKLKFAHHAVVARKKSADTWLDKAEEEVWSEKDLRRHVSEDGGTKAPQARPQRVVLSIEPSLYEACVRAAGTDDVKAFIVGLIEAGVK